MLKTKRAERTSALLLMMVILVVTLGCSETQSQTETTKTAPATSQTTPETWSFDDTPEGDLPSGWKVEATNQKGDLAIWGIIKDTSAPSGQQALALISPPKNYGSNFNICWNSSSQFLDGEIQVDFKSISGHVDQGGGIMWRVQDKDNYYIARFNPLEDNFRIYYVKNGSRKKIANAKIALAAGKWHTMKIVQKGNQYQGYINGKKLIEGNNDKFLSSGGAGLWTKADAVTSFDDFSINP